MMNVEELTDELLYGLVQSKELSADLRQHVLREFRKRNYSMEQLDFLAIKHESASLPITKPFTNGEKALIIAIPFFPVIHAILANRNISRGEPKKWREHWRFVAIGYFIWTILAILIAKYIVFPK